MLSYLFQMAMLFKKIWDDGNYTGSFLLKHMLVNPPELRGRSILDLLDYYAGLLLQVCNYFRSQDLFLELKKLPQVRSRLKSKVREKARMEGGWLLESNRSVPPL